ncbi:MAG: VOC family protein [Planctomycetes bacterium]|nr:VOC family protein [Planctomycetota bacterium]
MTPSTGPWPGRFIWHDLMTTDGAKAQAFYRDLFDWRIEEHAMHGFVYRRILAGPGPIGGIVEERNLPNSHWMPYLAVDDVDAAAARIQELGGSVCVPPTDIPQTGRFAVVGDPQGATFSIFRGLPGSQGFDPDLPVAGRACWNELLTHDDAAAQAFYGALCGWRDEPKDMGPLGTYHVQMLGGKQAGGLMKNPQPGAPSCWLVYFLVDDLAAAGQRAARLGAQVLMAAQPIEGVGSFSLLADPVGAVFALFQPLPGSAPC